MEQLMMSMADRYREYLHDESRQTGFAESISFPETVEQVEKIVQFMHERQTIVTFQGGRTGLDGGTVPHGGHVLNLSKLCNIIAMRAGENGSFYVTAQAGLTLLELDSCLARRSFDTKNWDAQSKAALQLLKNSPQLFWPPAPTESSATIGGVISSNARGIWAYRYGDARSYSSDIRTVETSCDQKVIVELTLRLIPFQAAIWGIGFFFLHDEDAIRFTQSVDSAPNALTDTVAAVEYMDKISLECIAQFKKTASRLQGLPDVEERFAAMVYVELQGPSDDALEQTAQWLLQCAADYASDIDASWALSSAVETQRIRSFRHAAQESVHAVIDRSRADDSRIAALGTYMVFPKSTLIEAVRECRKDIACAQLTAALFGHACGGRMRVCLLPRNYDEFERGRELLLRWTRGSV